MSYILDALRKADAQRARGAVPDLAAQPLAGAGDDAEPPRRPLGWVIGAAALAALAVAALLWPRSQPAPPEPARALAVPPAPVEPAPRAAPAMPSPPVVAATPAPPLLDAPTTEVSLLPLPRPAAASAPPGTASAARPLQAASAPTAAAVPPARLPKLAELPPDLRQQVPALTIGGAMHSQNAASRMLIINGQLYHEGDQPAPGVLLERIQLRSAVLSVRGTRFEIGY